MPNIQDYVIWRGDLPLDRVPLCDVDALLLSYLSYMPYDNIVGDAFDGGISLRDAAQKLLEVNEREKTPLAYNVKEDRKLLAALMESARFGDIRLVGYTNRVDTKLEEQFSAVTYLLGEGHAFVAFRGTDNTVVGWKEDFNMAFRCPVPAQESAARYVDEAADAIDGPLLCGGHSKGGNLAVYGAAMCFDVARERIERAYSHDGPGFVEEFLNGNAFADLSGRIDKTLPRSSIFGMMFEAQEDYAIVESTEFSLLQHNPFSWVVDGCDFVYCERLSAGARYVDGSIREMLLAVSPSERERFVDALFSVLEATGAERFADIAGNLRESLPVMLQAAQGFDKDTRRFVSQTIVAILKCALLPKRPQIDIPAAGKSLAEQLEAWQSELLR